MGKQSQYKPEVTKVQLQNLNVGLSLLLAENLITWLPEAQFGWRWQEGVNGDGEGVNRYNAQVQVQFARADIYAFKASNFQGVNKQIALDQ